MKDTSEVGKAYRAILCLGNQIYVNSLGSCNTEKKKLWFNLQLAQKPIECLEYVILHELLHLKERTHNSVFISYMDLYMKDWRAVRKELNDLRLDYYNTVE